MERFTKYRLGDIAEMRYGKLPPEFIKSGMYPVYSGYRYVGYTDSFNCSKGTIIVVARGVGGTGDVKLIEQDCYLTNLSISVVLNPSICDPAYFYYKFFKNNLRYLDSGSAQSQITIDDLKRLEVSLPSLLEQQRIIRILKSFDDKIALNNRINHNLEEQAQALYKSWFVDFEPFKNGKFVDSELGIIPEGWRVLPFSAFVQISNEKVDSEFIPEFSVTNTGIIPRDAKFNKQLSASSLKNKITRKGDLVFGMSREILNWGVMKDVVGGVSSAYTVYKIDKQIMDEDFLRLYIQHHPEYFKDLIKPAAREGQGIDKKVLASKKIYIPEDTLWIGFKEKINSLVEAQHQLMNQTDLLANLRDEVLPTLMERSPMSQNLNC